MKLLKVGLTHGDINGIGPELLLKALAAPELTDICIPVVFSSEGILAETAKAITSDEPLPHKFNNITSAQDAVEGQINLVNVCADESPVIEYGQQTETSMKAEADSLTAALEAYRNGGIDVLVTLPGHLDNEIDSHALCDFVHRVLGEEDSEAFDWIINGDFRSLILHPIGGSTELGEGLASEAFQDHLTVIYNNLRQDFGYIRPRIAVVSAIDRIFGDLRALQEQGITAFGPFPAEGFAQTESYRHYDAVLFLDEDNTRNNILKSLPAEQMIGYVSSLPLVLTYPLQDVSYADAGHDSKNPDQLLAAIFAAIDIFRSRQRYLEATRHPLEKQWVPRGKDDFKLDLTKEE